jgi:nucleoside-diphosphate-sugar epimerase
MSKTLLLIGGTGFFGKSILKYFYYHRNYLKKKFSKIIILSRGKIKIKFNNNLKKFFKLVKINSNIQYVKILPSADYVIYAAILKNYKEDHAAVKHYLNLAKKCHSKSKILYISSGAVYGKQRRSTAKFKENHLELYKKINFKEGYKEEYSNTKIKNEELFKRFAKKGKNVSIARCFTFVGQYLPQDSYYAVGNIIKNILTNESIKINADFKVIRSYMYDDDLVKWLLKILDNSTKDCPIYNVGSNDAISLHKLAILLAEKYNLSINFKNEKISMKTIDKYIPSIYKAKRKLNLSNNHTSLNAIIKTINLLKKNEKVN